MNRRALRWILIVVLTGAIVTAIWWSTRPKPIAVSIKPVTRGAVERAVANTRAGTVKACRRAKLAPSVGGQIAKLPVKEGDSVKTGQLLLELWNADLAAQELLAQREVVSARARARAACLKADLARRNADRLRQLRRSDAVSVEAADNVVAEADASRAECQAARAQEAVAEASVAVARANIERTRLTAPFDGVIAEINGELFEFVTPSPVGIPTPPAVDIIDNTCFYVTAPIDEVDAAGVRVGMPARISLDAFRDRRFEGKVMRIADYVLDIEKQARTVDVDVIFNNPQDREALLAGYSADIEVVLEIRRDVVRVPTEAVMEDRRVYVFSPTGKAVELREIDKGIANWDFTEVRSGLTPDELVVVNVDNPGLKDGAAAEPLGETQ